MRWPAPLLRRNKASHKNDFGHVLIVAGSPTMLGAAALTGLAAMRSGAGLTTIAIPKSLNLTLQKKISPVIMTCPLPETRQGSVSLKAFHVLSSVWSRFASVAIGPGITTAPGTIKFVEKMYQFCPLPMVVDADALNALAGRLKRGSSLLAPRILTPHPGEMARLTGLSKAKIEADRTGVAVTYAKRFGCVLVLKGHRTVVASPQGRVYVNTTGNAGMATAGSGDVLTGIMTAFLAQGISSFEAAQWAVYVHGACGDRIWKKKGHFFMDATQLIDELPFVFKTASKHTG